MSGAGPVEGFGEALPDVRTPPPGPASRALARRLRATESRNVTYLADDFPVFWDEARGANVRDADGNVYLDLTAAFGVALLGHGDPRIDAAVRDQAGRLVHGMGDVHPPTVRVELLERLAEVVPWDEPRTVLGVGGAEAVEVALKTALLATGRPGIVAFTGGYHGLTGGALAATARGEFRRPFERRLYDGVSFVPFPDRLREEAGAGERALERLEEALRNGAPNGDAVGAVVVEPVQGRAGVRLPPDGFLAEVRDRAREAGALVIADEIFTGLGRTGALLASHRGGLEPDLVCLGKALGGGWPLSACVGPAEVMDAWPESEGEALHTSTFLGHPAACAAAVAFLDALRQDGVADEAAARGLLLEDALRREVGDVPGVAEVRGAGLMIGIELVDDGRTMEPAAGAGAAVAARALREGVLVLPAGDAGHVVQLTPPVTLTEAQAAAGVEGLGRAVRDVMDARRAER